MLESIRVIEVSHAVAGPTASQILADYGAEVIKIENPLGGDIFRDVPGMGPTMFLAVNRGKKSVGINLKSREGLSIFYDLVKKSDVVIENLGPGVAEKLGITYRKIKRANQRVVCCKVESFGSGPFEKVPAFDPILQAAVGIMSTTGFPPDHYARAGVSLVDMATGMQAASGVLASLLNRELNGGKGSELRVSLYDAAAYFMSYWVAMYDLFGRDTSPLGSGHIFGAPYNLFRTKDGFVYIAVANDSVWQSFCKSLSFQDLLDDKRFRLAKDRVSKKKSLESIIARRLRKMESAHIEESLLGSRVPFGKFNTVKTLLQDPHFLGKGIMKEYEYGQKRYRTIVNPVIVDGSRLSASGSPPVLGADTEKVLRTILGMNSTKLRELKTKGIISDH
ncbi:MAG: CoA transferase [Thaumarchaeota archaeon]|nr:CoA transferase [Nitrososphaerota archaeon]